MKKFPRQQISYWKKVKDDYQWCKDTIDSLLIEYTDNSRIVNYADSYDRKLANYQLYNNMINQADFERECNPLGIEVGQFKDEIQPYNKTYNKIQVLLGEELRRPFNYKVALINSEGIKSKLEHKDALLKNFAMSKVQEAIKSVSDIFPVELVGEADQIMDPKEIDKYMATSYLDAKEIAGSKIIDYLYKKLDIPDKKNDAFKHALIAGEEFVYVGTKNDQPYVEVLNPLGFFHYKSSEVKYVQDGLFAGYKTYMTSGEILDKYGRYLSEEDKKRIDADYQGPIGSDSLIAKDMRYGHETNDSNKYLTPQLFEGSYGQSDPNDWLVSHVEWRSQKKVGFLKFINDYGDTEEILVSEDYRLPKNATKTTVEEKWGAKTTYYYWTDINGNPYTLYWDYIPEIWEGTRIGNDIYCMMGPRPNQFRSLDDPYDVSLSYHGCIYNAMNAESVSLMERMKPYQYLFFIVMHKIKKLIAQDNGKIFNIDTTMLDPKLGWEKTMYYLKEMNMHFYNPLQNADQPGAHQRSSALSSTDWSTAQNISNYVNLLLALDQQISDVAGITKQREGQTLPGEAVTNAQANIQMSSVITEIYFQAHDKNWEKILNSLLNVTQEAWRGKNVTKQYILDDMSLATINVDMEELDDSDLGIFVTTAGREQFLFDALQSMGQALISSNKARFSDLIKVYKSTSAEALEREIVASEQEVMKQEAEQQQLNRETQMEIARLETELERYKIDTDNETKIKVAEIGSFRFLQDQDADNNGVPDQLEIEKFKVDTEIKKEKLQLEREKLEMEEKQREKDRAAKKASK
jgi:hypothetical protein